MRTILPLLLLAFGFHAAAQTITTTVKYGKANKQALLLYLSYSDDVAEGTILKKLKETGYEPEATGSMFWKQNKVNGFYVFKGVTLKGDKQEIVDLYFRVDRRGSRKDNQSVIYMLTSKGGEEFITDASDAATHAAARRFLSGFVGETASYKHSLDVQAQEETVKKAEKKLVDLIEEEKDLNRRIARLQEELKKNHETQLIQQTAIETEKRKLEELKLEKK